MKYLGEMETDRSRANSGSKSIKISIATAAHRYSSSRCIAGRDEVRLSDVG
jgi:hypothetical protein